MSHKLLTALLVVAIAALGYFAYWGLRMERKVHDMETQLSAYELGLGINTSDIDGLETRVAGLDCNPGSAPVFLKAYINLDYYYSLECPASWEAHEYLGGREVLFWGPGGIAQVSVLVDESTIPLEDSLDWWIWMSGGELLSKTKMDNYDGWEAVYVGTVFDEGRWVKRCFVQHGGYRYNIAYSVRQSEYDQHISQLDFAYNSFRFHEFYEP